MRPPCMRTEGDDNNNGCRVCASYAHDEGELRNGSILANVLFTDVDVHDAKSTIAYMAKYMTKDSAEIKSSQSQELLSGTHGAGVKQGP